MMDETSLKSIGKGKKNIINKFNVEKMCFSHIQSIKIIKLNAHYNTTRWKKFKIL